MSRTLSIERPRSLAGVITERLRDAITNGEFAPGEALSEDTLAASLGTSRTPVREALNSLQYEGLVTIVPQKGTFVFAASADDVGELCDFRATLEVKAARLSMQHHRDATLASLKKAYSEMTRARKQHDELAYARADHDFHASFLAHCDNHYLRSAYLLASGRVGALRAYLAAHVRGEPNRSLHEHEALIELWTQGDLAGIEALLAQHIMRTQDSYLSAFETGQISANATALGERPTKRRRKTPAPDAR
ncbi:GntR family transcriptional regulator [Pararobbsia silviterrae]|nr:GntR family transcriptional regulator [Pararobbsia silviterrae]